MRGRTISSSGQLFGEMQISDGSTTGHPTHFRWWGIPKGWGRFPDWLNSFILPVMVAKLLEILSRKV